MKLKLKYIVRLYPGRACRIDVRWLVLNLALTMNVELNMMLITVVLKLRVRAVGVVYFAVAFGAYVAVRCGSRR